MARNHAEEPVIDVLRPLGFDQFQETAGSGHRDRYQSGAIPHQGRLRGVAATCHAATVRKPNKVAQLVPMRQCAQAHNVFQALHVRCV